MKKLFLIICIATLWCCNKKETNVVKETTSLIDTNNPLNKLKYDNKIDFYCKMDITKYGVSDTVTYKGKLYGFCSTMCKHEFLMKPEGYLAKQ
jgi:YHS domain-containing protein